MREHQAELLDFFRGCIARPQDAAVLAQNVAANFDIRPHMREKRATSAKPAGREFASVGVEYLEGPYRVAPPFARSGSVPWQDVVDLVTGLQSEGRALARGGRPVNADARLASAGRWEGACDTLDAPPSGHQPVSRMIGPPRGSDKRMSADAEADARADFDTSLIELRGDLLAYLRRRLGDRETAADLTQEAVLRMMKYRDTTQVKDRRGMLFRIAHRLVLDHRRTQYRRHAARHVSLDDVGELSMDQGSVEAIVDARQAMHRLLTRVTDDLPPKCRLAFVMSRFEGLTNKQVAARMGISDKMVEKYITRALVACRLAVGERGA